MIYVSWDSNHKYCLVLLIAMGFVPIMQPMHVCRQLFSWLTTSFHGPELKLQITIMIQLRRSDRRTPPTAHSRTCRSPNDPIYSSRSRAPMPTTPFPPCVVVPIRPPHFALPPPVPRSDAAHSLRPPLHCLPVRPPPRRIPHGAQSVLPRLHRAASSLRPPPLSWRGSTTDALSSR
jgi:hypothetical protein